MRSSNHHNPSRVDCNSCHTQAAGFSLGPEIAQLNRNFTYTGNTVANQIATLDHIGMFGSSPGNPSQLARLTDPGNAAAPMAERARAYLHSNCSNCHRPGAITSSNSRSQVGDLRATASMAQTNLCEVDPGAGNLGITGAKLIATANVSRSILHQRMSRRGAYQMPPLATEAVDQSALDIMRNWIENTACR
jgi:cytochrome c peroxidase